MVLYCYCLFVFSEFGFLVVCVCVCVWGGDCNQELFYLTMPSTDFISGYMALHTQIAREKTRCRHMGYSFRLAARVHLYASSHRQVNTYHGLCYTSRGGARCSSMVRAFAHGAMGRRIDPSWGGPIELFLVPATTGVTNAMVCAILSVGWCIEKNPCC